MMKSTNLFFILLFTINLYAQKSFNVSGIVKETNGESIAFANVLLVKSTDSTLVKGVITMEDGSYSLNNILSGNYLVISNMIGYQPVYSKIFYLNQNYKVETLVLREGEALDEVVIIAKKPLYTQEIDRMIINVENSIVSVGGSALDILERSPGIVLDRQSNNISIVGKSGAEVMINGKRRYLPASAIVQLLDGMRAENIKSIELITTPPSRFDAEGNAGFINIVMKQLTDIGLNGSFSITNGFRNSGNVNADNLNFNYRKDKLNIFGNYSFTRGTLEEIFKIGRERQENIMLQTKSTITNRDAKYSDHNMRLGLDYQLTDKTIMGLIATGSDDKFSMKDALANSISTLNGVPTSYEELILSEVNHWKHYDINYNIKHNFSNNKFINFDLLYLFYKVKNPIDYENSFFDENHIFLYDELSRSRKSTPIKRWVSNIAFSSQVNKQLNFETGIKGAFSTFEDEVSVEQFINNEWNIDESLTVKSDLVEDIYAAYIDFDYKISEKWNARFGVRYEYTNSVLTSDKEGIVVDNQYGNIFPTLFLNRKFGDDLNMNLSYTKRISRPTFRQMAPFVIMWNSDTFNLGNIEIQPGISNSIKYDINYKSTIFSLQYTHEDSPIAQFQSTYDEENDRIIFTSENMDYSKIFSVVVGMPLKITDWWRTQNNLIYTYQDIRAFNSKKETYNLSMGNIMANSTSLFKFSESVSAEISSKYIGSKYDGTSKREKYYIIDLGIQKKFGNNWGSLKFGIDDVFDSTKWVVITDVPDQNLQVFGDFKLTQRTFKLTYSRSFGNRKLKSSRKRDKDFDEERRRVN